MTVACRQADLRATVAKSGLARAPHAVLGLPVQRRAASVRPASGRVGRFSMRLERRTQRSIAWETIRTA